MKHLFVAVLSLYCFKIQCKLGEHDRMICTELVGEFSHEAAMKEFSEKEKLGESVWFSCRPKNEGWREPRASVSPK